MISRQYDKRIEIFTIENISDGFGGNTVQDVSLGNFWAEVKQNTAFKDNSIGKADIKNNYSFKIRSNPNLTPEIDNLSIIYRGKKYVVNDFRYADELFREINMTANGG